MLIRRSAKMLAENVVSFAKSSCTTLKGFLSRWRRFFGLGLYACMLICRSAKMLAENVDFAWPGFKKKNLALRKTALESTLPPHNDGVARRVSERIESCFHPQSELL